MLEKLRDASKTWVAGILIGLLVISFAIFGINDIFSGQQSTTLAKVGDIEIDGRDFDTQFARRVRNELGPDGRPMNIGEARAAGLDRVVLDDMIADAAVLAKAQQLGLTASTETVVEYIRAQIPPSQLPQLLQNLEMSEEQLIEMIRADMIREQLLEIARAVPTAPRGLGLLLQSFANERRTIEYLALPADRAGEIPAPDDAALQAFIDADPAPWTAPETRAITVLSVGPADVLDQVQVSDEDVQTTYELEKAKYETPEQRELLQLVFTTKEEADAARKALDEGKTFEDLLDERSISPQDASLGTVAKGDPSVPAGAFEVPEGQVTAPLETPFGWKLFKVVKVTPGSSRSFEEVKEEIRTTLATERAIDLIYPYTDQIEDARAAGQTLEEIAAQLNIKATAYAAIDAEGRDAAGQPIAGIPDGPDFLADVFRVGEGEQGDLNQTPAHVFYVVQVNTITPAAVRPLDQIREAATAAWLRAEQGKKLVAIAQEAATKADAAGTSLEDLAKELGVEGKTSAPLGREESGEDLSSAAVTALFATPKGKWIAAEGAVAPGAVIARVKDVTTGSTAEDALGEEREVRTGVTRDIGSEAYDAYRAAIVAATPVEINEALFNAARTRVQ